MLAIPVAILVLWMLTRERPEPVKVHYHSPTCIHGLDE
jgi:hypothetical protein